MSWPVDFDLSRVNLATNRVQPGDGARQLATVREILARLGQQPGIVLADEVGMGKTFVALAIAVAAAIGDKGKRPVVVMVPSSLRNKWPDDWEVFKSLCLPNAADRALPVASASSALAFFRLLDDHRDKRARIIFLTHGAFYAGLDNPWTKLALIKRALHGMHLGERRSSLPRFVANLLRTKSSFSDPDLFYRLLRAPYDEWMDLINQYALHGDDRLTDDPVPEAVQRVLERGELDLDGLHEALRNLPARTSAHVNDRLLAVRGILRDAMRSVWPQTLAQSRFRSPLMILDEAHHLKNPATRLASLFVEDDAKNESDLIAGALQGGFERMLFLTATPFQLGHHELLNVLTRFKGIAWPSLPSMNRDGHETALSELQKALDEAHRAATNFDWKWRLVRPEDLTDAPGNPIPVETWWEQVSGGALALSPRLEPVLAAFHRTRDAMRKAEGLLKPWVVRHLRPRVFPETTRERRLRMVGAALNSGSATDVSGLSIADEAVLPFLLAARTQALFSRKAKAMKQASIRATFAEGLASSYEAFLETRRIAVVSAGKIDAPLAIEQVSDEQESIVATVEDRRIERYLTQLQSTLPSPTAYARHPKMAALVARVVSLWDAGEKVVVFCHFRRTGRAAVRHISAALEARLWSEVSRKMGCGDEDARRTVDLASEAFDEGRPLQKVLDDYVLGLEPARNLSERERAQLASIVRRFVRTPLFLGRYVDLGAARREVALQRALEAPDGSGQALQDKIGSFVKFIAERCQAKEREAYLEALERIQPGLRGERPQDGEDEEADEKLLPNVRLANGAVAGDTRRRLLLAFNTPFFPEILVASSVLAEGVDLHLNCRHIIHYDLSWNPSTIEQRTGRVDRLGAKAEQVREPIHVYLPFVSGTQDEKMYRVVTDRERWFQVVMGQDYRTDEASTDKLAERVPLPESVARELGFRLEANAGR